ncbi:MAG TPA: hypothetical protein VFS89_03865 [Nitrosospira sp.]|nr:hypothetical protein [Nitrosospira sp.]
MTMDLPKNISISGDEKFQLKLEANLHYAIEAVLAELFDFNAKAKETRTVRLTAGRAEWK